MNQPYLAFLLLLAFVAFNAALLIGLSHLVAPRKPTSVKDAPYESGMPHDTTDVTKRRHEQTSRSTVTKTRSTPSRDVLP